MTTDERNAAKLAGVHYEVSTKVKAIIEAMRALGFEMLVTDGFRTVKEQQALYAQGRTSPGSIVTKADGVTNLSNHQSGRAVDCCFIVKGQPSWADSNPWLLYGAMATALGLTWGGSWTTPDRPHVELPK